MKWSIGNKISSAFGLALAALLVIGVVSRDSPAKLINSRSAIGAGWPTPPDHRHGA
jgi:hypothetical protein